MAPVTSADVALEAIRVVSSTLYLVVAAVVLRRSVGPEARPAQLSFVVWWTGVAALGFVTIPSSLGFNVAEAGLTAWRLWIYVVLGVIFLAVSGLIHYLLYLYTGRPGIWKVAAAYFVVMLTFTTWLIEGFGPFLATNDAAEATVEFTRDHPRLLTLAFSLLLTLPALGSAIAYSALFFQLRDRASRYRVAMVSIGIGGWFAYSVLSTLVRFVLQVEGTSYAGRVAGQLIGLTAALLILFAFVPPAPIRRWLADAQSGGVPNDA